MGSRQRGADRADSAVGGPRRPRLISTMVVWWVIAGLCANVLGVIGAAPALALSALSIAGLLHSAVGFWQDGGRRISAPGLYFFSSALFVFFPALYVALYDLNFQHGPIAMLPALNYWYFTQLAMHHLFWEPRVQVEGAVLQPTRVEVLRWGRFWGLVLTATGVLASAQGVGEPGVVAGVAFTGVVVLSISTFARPGRISAAGYALVAVAALCYLEFVFTGFGRLQVGALGLAVAVAVAPRWRGRRAKLAIVVAFVPTLAYLAQSRVQFTSQTVSAAAAARSTGLESVYGPYVRFGELLHIDAVEGLDHSYLHTFWASLVALVPRELWPGKPIGFGAELGLYFRPELAGSGHSELALSSGEFLFAGGLVGLAVMPLLLAPAVTVLDRVLVRAQTRRFAARRDVVLAAAAVILATGLADLVWGGTFSYSSRVGPRLLVLLPLLVLAWQTRSQRAGEDVPVPEPSPARLSPAIEVRSTRDGGARSTG